MPFSVALQQPRFAPDDTGDLGQWDEIVSGIANIASTAITAGTSYLTAKNQQTAALNRVATQAGTYLPYQTTTAPVQYAVQPSFTSSPMFLPLVAGLGLLLVVVLAGGKR
jgi:hypothetical protein